jgi:hypothetical protein
MSDGYTNFAGQVREKGKELNRLLNRPCCPFLMDEDFIDALFSGLENIEEFKVQVAMMEKDMNEGRREYTFNQVVEDLQLVALDMVDEHGNVAWKQVKMPVDEMKTNDCFHWLSGGCTRGDKCNFKHDPKKKGAGGTPPWFKPTEKKDGVRQSERIKKTPSCSHGGCNSKDPKQEAHHLKQIKEYQNMQNEMVSMKKQIETMNLAARQRTAWGMEECQEGLHVVVAAEAQNDCVGTEVGENETSHSISFVDHNFWGDPIKPNCDEQKYTNFQSDVSNETCPPIKNQETVLVAAVENARSISIPERHGHAFVALELCRPSLTLVRPCTYMGTETVYMESHHVT